MKKYATVDPTTGKVVREFATMSDPDVQQALARALVAYQSWRSADLADRAALLSRVADLHRQHAGELAELTTLEMGKPIAQAKAEVELSAAIYEYYATTGPAASCRRGTRHRRPRAGAGAARLRSGRCWASCRGTSPTTRPLGSWRRTCCWATRSCSNTPATARSRRCGSPRSSTPPARPPGCIRTCSPPASRWRR